MPKSLKPPRPLEKDVQAACRAVLELHGCRVFRRNTGQVPAEYKGKRRVFRAGENGAADLYGWFPGGLHFECEVKRDGERPRYDQVLFLRDCWRRGIPAFWVDSADSLSRFLPVLIDGGRVVYLDDEWVFREKDKMTGRVVVRTAPGGEFEIQARGFGDGD